MLLLDAWLFICCTVIFLFCLAVPFVSSKTRCEYELDEFLEAHGQKEEKEKSPAPNGAFSKVLELG
jgi:hypothetical protein